MNYRLLGRTGIRVSPLCFGAMSFGAEADEATSADLYKTVREAGINFIDTYHRGGLYPRDLPFIGGQEGGGTGGVPSFDAREPGREMTDAVDLDVVRMAVPAELVVDGDEVGVLGPQDRCKPARRLVDALHRDRTRIADVAAAEGGDVVRVGDAVRVAVSNRYSQVMVKVSVVCERSSVAEPSRSAWW